MNMASFPFNETFGSTIGSSVSKGLGALRLNYTPHIETKDYADRAANAYFQKLTQGYTGAVDFQASDAIMANICAAYLAAFFEIGRRAYGCMHYFLPQNKAYAKTVVNMCGIRYDELIKDMANFRAEFNIRVAQFNASVALPKGFTLYSRWKYLNTNLFFEASDPNYATTTGFFPCYTMEYDATTAKTGTCIRSRRLTQRGDSVASECLTVTDYFAVIDRMLNALLDDDVRAIFGSTRRVYTQNDLVSIDVLDVDYLQNIVEHDIISAQIHNAKWLQDTPDFYNYLPASVATDGYTHGDIAVYQDADGRITSQTFVDSQDEILLYNLGSKGDMVLDMYSHLVTPSNVLDITALMWGLVPNSKRSVSVTDATGSRNIQVWDVFGRSEIILYVSAFYSDYNVGTFVEEYKASVLRQLVVADNGTLSKNDFSIMLRDWSWLYTINYCPLVYVAREVTDGMYDFTLFGELDKYTVLDMTDLMKLQRRCFYTLLSMPDNNKSVT
nr:capsid protein [Picobirnavirus sp.]